jgi:uncharacterized protein (DUF433 family)
MDTAAITAYIELNPQVRFGKPVVKGTRMTVAEMLANNMSAADIAEDLPRIGTAQVWACLLYAAHRESIVLHVAAWCVYCWMKTCRGGTTSASRAAIRSSAPTSSSE